MSEAARQLLEQAEKKRSTRASIFSWITGSPDRYEECAQLYTDAANKFKGETQWMDAGNAFMKSAECHFKLEEQDDAIGKLVQAASCFKKSSEPKNAIDPLTRAIELLTERGRFHPAARHAKELAEIYEEHLSDLNNAVKYYQKAADWYQSEDAIATSNSCSLKVAMISALAENYNIAIEKFESIARSSIESPLSKYSVKDYLFRAMLCRLCSESLTMDGTDSMKNILAEYEIMDSSFSMTRECNLIKDIIESIEKDDIESFTDHVAEYDHMLKLDHWKATMLLNIKKKFDEEPSLT